MQAWGCWGLRASAAAVSHPYLPWAQEPLPLGSGPPLHAWSLQQEQGEGVGSAVCDSDSNSSVRAQPLASLRLHAANQQHQQLPATDTQLLRPLGARKLISSWLGWCSAVGGD